MWFCSKWTNFSCNNFYFPLQLLYGSAFDIDTWKLSNKRIIMKKQTSRKRICNWYSLWLPVYSGSCTDPCNGLPEMDPLHGLLQWRQWWFDCSKKIPEKMPLVRQQIWNIIHPLPCIYFNNRQVILGPKPYSLGIALRSMWALSQGVAEGLKEPYSRSLM